MSAMYQTFQNTPIFQTAWRGFLGSKWTDEVNVRDFIQNNYTQYDGDESFLAAPTSATHLLWERLQKLQKEEHEKGGVLECETEIVSSLTAYGPGYIDPELKDLERIVGLQTDKPLKSIITLFSVSHRWFIVRIRIRSIRTCGSFACVWKRDFASVSSTSWYTRICSKNIFLFHTH